MNNLPSYEIWNWIKGYEGRFEISNRGRLRSWVGVGGANKHTKGKHIRFLQSPKIRVTLPNKFGYFNTVIGNEGKGDIKNIRVHREVAIQFVINPDSLNKIEVNHINGIKSCNEWWNFEWVTRIESIAHAFETGLITVQLGEINGKSKLDNVKVMFIYNSKLSYRQLSKEFNVSMSAISDIKRGRTWWHLTGQKRSFKPSEIGKFKKQ